MQRRTPWMRRGLITLLACFFSIGANAQSADNKGTASASFADVMEFVGAEGWRADLQTMCDELELPPAPEGCIFRQISISEIEGRGDPRGINVPGYQRSFPSYALIFHLGPLVGEFFVVSPEGELMRAFIRTKGQGYSSVLIDDLKNEFEKDRDYFIGNLARIKQGLPVQRSTPK